MPFQGRKNVAVLRGRWEGTLATDTIHMKERITQWGKYIGIKHRSFIHCKEMSRCCKTVPGLLAVPHRLPGSWNREVCQMPTLVVHKVTPVCVPRNNALLSPSLLLSRYCEVWHQVTSTYTQQGKMTRSAPWLLNCH